MNDKLVYPSEKPSSLIQFFSFGEDCSTLSKVSFLLLPLILFSGWLIYLFWTLGLSGWWTQLTGLGIICFGLIYICNNLTLKKADLRWVIAPILIFILAWYVPWWDYHHQRYDTGAHIFSALEFLNHRSFPEYLLFRSPLVPATLSMEILITKNTYTMVWVPLILFVGTAWQVQHLAERWGSPKRAVLCTIAFIFLPTIRYWGQMAMTDVAVCGIWIFALHLFILSERHPGNKKFAALVGLSIGITFMTKQTHIYLFGLIGWYLLRDKNFDRVKNFTVGWLLITTPFMLHNWILNGHPFYPLLGQTEFALKSVTGTYDTFTTADFLSDLTAEFSFIVILFSILGVWMLAKKNRTEATSVAVMLTPLLILNGVVLDWGEPRYNTPILALILLFIGVEISSEPLSKSKRYSPTSEQIFSIIGVVLLISISIMHLLELPEESKNAHTYNENMEAWTIFDTGGLDEIGSSETLFAGRATSISLMTGIHTIRYEPRDYGCDCTNDLIANTLSLYSASYAMTTNVAPYFDWEKDFDWQLGHGLIELENIYFDGWWTAALWKIDNTSYQDPELFYSHNTGEVTGDLTILGPNDSLTIGNASVTLKWIEVTTIRPYQQVMRVLGGEVDLMKNGSIDGGEDSSFAHGDRLSASDESYIYVWIESFD